MFRNVAEADSLFPESEGINAEKKWRWSQPGFIDVKHPTDLTNYKFLSKKLNSEAFWDGTFNQPILPLADKLHRDARNFW